MTQTAEGVHTIDTGYGGVERAAVYLVVHDGRAALIDAGTPRTTRAILHGLAQHGVRPEQVDWILATHVHLDHGSGAAALLDACPSARVRAHPRGRPHLLDPGRLVASGRTIFGADRFDRLFGEVRPAPGDRVDPIEDGETVRVGDVPLHVLHTPGHARHHVVIVDEAAGVVFTGDTFGTRPARMAPGERPFLLCSSPPTEFDPDPALESIDRIASCGVDRTALTHYGCIDGIAAAGDSLKRSVRAFAAIVDEACATDVPDDALDAFCLERVQAALADQLAWCAVSPSDEDQRRLRADVRMNAAGLAHAVRKRRRA